MTLDLPENSPAHALPWIITFGPLDDDEVWEPVVCGPYEREHALALAESVVVDERLLAVVEPVRPHVSIEEIRAQIGASRLAAAVDADVAEAEAVEHALVADIDLTSVSGGLGQFATGIAAQPEEREAEAPAEPPSVDEVRAGFARVAARLAGD